MTFASTLQPNIHVIGDAAIAGAMPKSAFAANAQAKVCAAAVAALLAGDAPPIAEADQYLLQPGRRRITAFRSPASITRPTASSPMSRAPAGSARSTRRPRPRTEEAHARRSLVPHDHRRSVRLKRRSRMAWRAVVAGLDCCCGRRPAAARADRCRALRDRRRRDPGVADRRAGRSGARPRDRRRPPGRAVPAVPYRAVPGAASAGHAGAGSARRRVAAVAGAAAPAARRCARRLNPDTIMPPYYRVEGLARVAPAYAGKPILDAAQIEDVVAFLATLTRLGQRDGLNLDPQPSRRVFLRRTAAVAAARGRRHLAVAPARATPEAMRQAIRAVSARPRRARQGDARHPGAGRERQHGAADRVGRKPDDARRPRQGDPRLQREEPAAARDLGRARAARRHARRWRPASSSPTRSRSSRSPR